MQRMSNRNETRPEISRVWCVNRHNWGFLQKMQLKQVDEMPVSSGFLNLKIIDKEIIYDYIN